jgi:hypothetical protein
MTNLVKVITTKVSVTRCRQHLENTITNFKNWKYQRKYMIQEEPTVPFKTSLNKPKELQQKNVENDNMVQTSWYLGTFQL